MGNASVRLMLAIMLVIVAGAPKAMAEADLPKARALFEKGEVRYRQGRFKEALAYYQAAQEIVRRPSMVLNVAQCYRQLGLLTKALFNYRLYLADWVRVNPDRTPPFQKEVKGHISTIAETLSQRRRESERQQTLLQTKHRQRTIWGYATMSVAGAAAITAAILYGVGFSRESDAHARYLAAQDSTAIENEWQNTQAARNLVTGGHIAGAVGGAALAVSIYLLVSRPTLEQPKRAAWIVEPAANGWGMQVRGTF
jgi:tetratricopeptide (TPR) repeat protein